MNGSFDQPSIRKFNPGTFQPDEEVMRQFVVRNHEFDIVLEVLRGNIDSHSCQHVLVVAPRGRGKTMLLARIAAELRIDDALSQRLFPVRFMEESQEIFTLADFWLESLFHLAKESAAHDPELAQELRKTHAALTVRWREEALEQHARAAVLEAADRLGRKLVLMVENLQALCEGVDADFGWKLRGVLQSEPSIILLATATSRFAGLDDAHQPFFELFRIVNLEPLDTEACRRLWHVVSGDEVQGREIKPLQILTGGSPRLLVIIGEFARHRSLRQLLENLVKLIDDHTEYFRGHLEVLPKTERRVYLAVIDLWQPSSTAEVGARARMDVRTVSALLGRLVDRGVVVVEGRGRQRRYAAAERLYSIYYKLRRERDEAAVVRNLIRFMAVFYSDTELAGMSDRLISEAAQLPFIRGGIEQAMAETPRINNVFAGMVRSDIGKVVERFEDSKAPELQIQDAITLFNKGAAQRQLGDFQAAIATCDEVVGRFGDSDAPELKNLAAIALFNKGVAQEQLGDPAAAIATYDEVVGRFGDSDALELQDLAAKALFNKGVAQEQLGDPAAAIAAYDAVVEHIGDGEAPELQSQVAKALVNKGAAQRQLGDFQAAIATYDGVVERFEDGDTPKLKNLAAIALFNKGVAQEQLGDPAAAIATYDEVVERVGDSDAPELRDLAAKALFNKGGAQVQLGDPAAAIAAYDAVVERFGDGDTPELQCQVAKALVNKGVAQEQLGDPAAAIAAYDAVVEHIGDGEAPELQSQVAKALVNKGAAQRQLGDFQAAIATYDEVVKRFEDGDTSELKYLVAMALVYKGVTQANLSRLEEALHTCDEFERRVRGLIKEDGIVLKWEASWVRTTALLIQGKRLAAMDAFRSVYAAFVPRNPTMMREVVVRILDLIAIGAPEHDLVEILSSDPEKSDALAPLVVALRQQVGEVVRAPAEIIEVAADIRERIEAAKGWAGLEPQPGQ